jgi:hypothetical protein
MMETNVTIISTNLNKYLLDNYKDYKVVDGDFKIGDLLNEKKVLFYNNLNNLDDNTLKEIFRVFKESNIKFVVFACNLELSLYTKYLIVYDDKKILAEGLTNDILMNDKLLKRLGFKLPFMFELSLLLKDYNILDRIILDKERMKQELWK